MKGGMEGGGRVKGWNRGRGRVKGEWREGEGGNGGRVKGGTQVGARVKLRECPTHHNVGMLEDLQHVLTAQVNGQLDLLVQLDVHPHPLILYIMVCVCGGRGYVGRCDKMYV